MRAIALDGNLAMPSLVGVMILLDRSGSMSSIRAPMEAAFAQFVMEQKAANPDGMWLSLHQFDSGEHGQLSYETSYERKPLAEVGRLGLHPSGGTPLRDALYRFGTEARKVLDDANDPTERLVLVVITDGGENTSRVHGWPAVRELMQGLDGAQCETIWLGTTAALLEAQAELPAFQATGATLGYAHTAAGTSYGLTGMSASVASVRSGGMARSAMADYADAGDNSAAVTAELLSKLKAGTGR